jgi:hypothetical protein
MYQQLLIWPTCQKRIFIALPRKIETNEMLLLSLTYETLMYSLLQSIFLRDPSENTLITVLESRVSRRSPIYDA